MTVQSNQPICAPAAFPTAADLAQWLHAQGVDTAAWGHGDAKTVADLWQEHHHGECTLAADPALRIVHVVEVRVEQQGLLLIETEQQFADGRVRVRRRPPSEKLRPEEAPVAAAQRCLSEELALSPAAISFPTQEIPTRTLRDDSSSYPNLPSEYTFYTVHAQVTGLPTTSFTTPNAAHAAGDPIIAHRWAWVGRSVE